MTRRIEATIIHGLGIASGRAYGNRAAGTIPLQKPFLQRYLPEIADCHDGTINLLLDTPLEVRLPDVVTPPFKWRPSEPEFDERFGFTEINFFYGDTVQRAWIYIAEKSDHYLKTGVVEILTNFVTGIEYGRRCAIEVGRAKPACLSVV